MATLDDVVRELRGLREDIQGLRADVQAQSQGPGSSLPGGVAAGDGASGGGPGFLGSGGRAEAGLLKAGAAANAQLASIAAGAASDAFQAGITGGSSAAIQGGAIRGAFRAAGQIPGLGGLVAQTGFADLDNAANAVAAENASFARLGFSFTDEQIGQRLDIVQAEERRAREAASQVQNIANERATEQAGQAAGTAATVLEVATSVGVFGEEVKALTPLLTGLRLRLTGGQ